MSRSKALPAIFQGLDAGLRMFRWVVLVLLAFFFASGITMVQPNNQALVLRFGKLEGTTVADKVKDSGLLIALPYPIDQVIQVPVREEGEVTTEEVWKSLEDADKVTNFMIDPIKEGYVVTGDQNIVQAKITVKYKIVDPVAFQLWVDNPEAIITDTVLASLTQTVSSWKVNDVIRLQRLEGKKGADSEGTVAADADTDLAVKPAVATDTPANETESSDAKTDANSPQTKPGGTESLARLVWNGAQTRLDELNIGVTITALEFNEIHPPRHVIEWFREVQSEKIGMTTKMREAIGFANQTKNYAEAEKDGLIQNAKAERSAMTANAQAHLSVFRRVHAEYEKNPELVVRRLYVETLEEIFSKVGKLDYLDPGSRMIFSGSEKQQ